MAVTLGL